ncbi:MAG: hypothetical protein OEV42_21275, partial [Deltaproteobacteria bacterium]|nr:hypothetical protein [Deltaproteobacteria bacterium]
PVIVVDILDRFRIGSQVRRYFPGEIACLIIFVFYIARVGVVYIVASLTLTPFLLIVVSI